MKKELSLARSQLDGQIELVEKLSFYENFYQKVKRERDQEYSGQILGQKRPRVEEITEECLICLLGFSEMHRRYKMLNCEHDCFHRDCVEKWQKKDFANFEKCPLCMDHF